MSTARSGSGACSTARPAWSTCRSWGRCRTALLGAMPPVQQRDTAEAEAHVMRTTKLIAAAVRHFNRGQRAFFFALGYLGWFVSPWVLFVTTAAVVIVTWRRQFASNAWKAVGG